MKKHTLFILFVLISCSIYAQVNPKYLQGGVPEVDGKVVFSRAIKVNSAISDDKIFDLMSTWAQTNYDSPTDTKQRILLSDADEKSIACKGEDNLVFKKKPLLVDKATMMYQLIIEVESGKCVATIKNIKYDYNDNRRNKEPYTAENMISDKVALNGEKLNRYYDKFRIHTVDSVNSIFNSIDTYLNGVKKQGTAEVDNQAGTTISAAAPAVAVTTASLASMPAAETKTSSNATLTGFRQIAPDKIPGNIIKLLNDAMLITSGSKDNINVMTASWGGLGVFWDKPSAFCFVSPQRYSISTMDKGDTYTISFYTDAYKDALQYCGSASGRNEDKIKGSGLTPIKTPSGATAFSEAWMILECKKTIAQPLSQDAVTDKDASKEWSKNGLHKMYIGEILSVWIK